MIIKAKFCELAPQQNWFDTGNVLPTEFNGWNETWHCHVSLIFTASTYTTNHMNVNSATLWIVLFFLLFFYRNLGKSGLRVSCLGLGESLPNYNTIMRLWLWAWALHFPGHSRELLSVFVSLTTFSLHVSWLINGFMNRWWASLETKLQNKH